MMLSPHFSLYEFERSQTAARHGIDNVPNTLALEALRRLAGYVLEPVRALFNRPVTITSGYRNEKLNRLVGSKDTSQHMKGEAADFIVNGFTPMDVCLAIADSHIKFDQLILEFNSWVHISYVTEGRGEILTLDNYGTHRGLA